jgi:hypothetical protein
VFNSRNWSNRPSPPVKDPTNVGFSSDFPSRQDASWVGPDYYGSYHLQYILRMQLADLSKSVVTHLMSATDGLIISAAPGVINDVGQFGVAHL